MCLWGGGGRPKPSTLNPKPGRGWVVRGKKRVTIPSLRAPSWKHQTAEGQGISSPRSNCFRFTMVPRVATVPLEEDISRKGWYIYLCQGALVTLGSCLRWTEHIAARAGPVIITRTQSLALTERTSRHQAQAQALLRVWGLGLSFLLASSLECLLVRNAEQKQSGYRGYHLFTNNGKTTAAVATILRFSRLSPGLKLQPLKFLASAVPSP